AWILLSALAHVDLDFLGSEQPIVVGVGGGEVLVEGVEKFRQAHPAVGLAPEEVARLGGDHHQLLNGEKAVLVHIAEEEGLDHRLVELLSIDPAVAVLVMLPYPRLGIRRGRRLREHPAREAEHAQHRGDSGPCAHQLCTFHEPSGWRHAVPHALSGLPSITTSLWNSRQYAPLA